MQQFSVKKEKKKIGYALTVFWGQTQCAIFLCFSFVVVEISQCLFDCCGLAMWQLFKLFATLCVGLKSLIIYSLRQTVLRIERRFTGFCISTEKKTNTIIRWLFCFAMGFASFPLLSAIFVIELKQFLTRHLSTNFNFITGFKKIEVLSTLANSCTFKDGQIQQANRKKGLKKNNNNNS